MPPNTNAMQPQAVTFASHPRVTEPNYKVLIITPVFPPFVSVGGGGKFSLFENIYE